MPKPVVAAVNGPAVGIGLSLALAADLVIARESAYFLLAFVNIGLVPDGGSSLFVPERVGFTRASEMAMLGERVPARQALEWGLINRVAADDEFEAEVDALAQRLATGPTRSYAGTKRQLNAWLYARMDEQLELEADDPAGVRRERRLPGGRAGVRREAPAGVRRSMSAMARPRHSSASGLHILRRRMLKVLLTRGLTAALAGLALAPAAANAGIFFPEKGGSENADKIWTLYLLIFILAWIVFLGVAGRAGVGDGQVPRPQGHGRGPDPRQHAPGDRLDRRRVRDPRLHHGLHLHHAAGHQEPAGVGHRRQRQPGHARPTCSTPPRTSPTRPRAARA